MFLILALCFLFPLLYAEHRQAPVATIYVRPSLRESHQPFHPFGIEGIIPAIESAHAVAYAMKLAPTMDKDKIIVINVSGRGDKDVAAIARYRGEDLHE